MFTTAIGALTTYFRSRTLTAIERPVNVVTDRAQLTRKINYHLNYSSKPLYVRLSRFSEP